MTPIAITAHLYSGFVASDPWSPAIDGILAYWHIREQLSEAEFSLRSGRNDLMEPVADLPLEIVRHENLWWYASSSPIYTQQAEVRRYLHRRFDQAHAEKYLPDGQRKVQVQAGPYKNARMAAMHHITDRVTWHVIGDLSAIERLLKRCSHVGAKVGAGFGRVRRWSYAEGDPEIARHWRPLPVAYALEQQLDGDVMDWGIRPPVRLACNTVSCVMPQKMQEIG